MHITSEVRATARDMLYLLESNRLDVVLVSFYTGSPQKLRIAQNKNCRWYREFCEAYQANRSKPRKRRKHDTLIKRNLTINALSDIINGRCCTTYATRLMPFIEAEIARPLDEYEIMANTFGV